MPRQPATEEERHAKRREAKERYKKANEVKCKYRQLLCARRKRGCDVSKAPSVDDAVAKLGPKPADTDEYTWSISFSDGDDRSCFDKTGIMRLETLHWAKVLRKHTIINAIENANCGKSRLLSPRSLQRKFHKEGADIDRNLAVSKACTYEHSAYIGKIFDRCECVDIVTISRDKKALMKCTKCGHKFKRRLLALAGGKHYCPRCQGSAARGIAASCNSAGYYAAHRYIGDREILDDVLYQRQTVSDYTYNHARADYLEACVDAHMLMAINPSVIQRFI